MAEIPADELLPDPDAPAPGADEEAVHARHRQELIKESLTMALYVAICLVAAIEASEPAEGEHPAALGVIWGTTIGLAVAHWFAFRLSSRYVGEGGRLHVFDAEIAAAGFLGALVVALLATLPLVLLPSGVEVTVAEAELLAFIGLVGYLVRRSGGASRSRSSVYGLGILVGAVAIVMLKTWIAGH